MSKILIISHANEREGAIDRFEEFLLKGSRDVSKLAHPLDNYAGQKSVLHENSVSRRSWTRFDFGVANLLFDFMLSIATIAKIRPKTIVGANNFDTLAGLVARTMIPKYHPRVLYFASDLSEGRFNSAIMNKIYFSVERLVLRQSDKTISNTHRAAARRMELGLPNGKSIVAPNFASRAAGVEARPLSTNKLIFVGALNKEHGVADFIKQAGLSIESLTIVGDGEELDDIDRYCRANGIQLVHRSNVPHGEVISLLRSFRGFGIAPYQPTASYIKYCSPLKVYEYVACGVPVIVSDEVELAEEIRRHQLGVVYSSYGEVQSKMTDFNLGVFAERSQQYSKRNTAEAVYGLITV